MNKLELIHSTKGTKVLLNGIEIEKVVRYNIDRDIRYGDDTEITLVFHVDNDDVDMTTDTI